MKNSKCVICDKPFSSVSQTDRLCSTPACEAIYIVHLRQAKRCCRSCGKPLQSEAGNLFYDEVCRNHQCQLAAVRFTNPGAVFCKVCGIWIPSASDPSGFHDCGCRCCRRISMELQSRKKAIELAILRRDRDAKIERIVRERIGLPIKAKGETGELSETEALEPEIVSIPFMENGLLPMSLDRIAALRANLLEIVKKMEIFQTAAVGEAVVAQTGDVKLGGDEELDNGENRKVGEDCGTDSNDQDDAKLVTLFQTACGMCRGECCTKGGNEAYLNLDVLERFAEMKQFTTVEEVIDAYLAKIPLVTVEGSCIYHGETGCGLSREMRSVTCNSFLCFPVQHLRDQSQKGKTEFILATSNIRDSFESPPKVFEIKRV